jgi:hypothetical protein
MHPALGAAHVLCAERFKIVMEYGFKAARAGGEKIRHKIKKV